jgi:ribosomal protein S12 methylthiotransferase
MVQLHVVSLGCAKNQVDTEAMLGRLLPGGCVLCATPAAADVLLVNTCAFIRAAEDESWQHIRALARGKRPGQKLIVCGCLPARHGVGAMRLPGVDAWLGVRDAAGVAACVQGWFPLRAAAPAVVRVTPRHSAYLRIADGCDHQCAFCTIPSIRGRYSSVPLPALVEQARRMADAGVVEVNLIAQDTTSYGHDLRPRRSLAALLTALAAIRGLQWIRVQYMYPASVTDELLTVMARTPAVCPYIDMPLQHIDDAILRRMRRPGRAVTEKVLDTIRARLPAAAVRTTFIVGYPGETPAVFRDLCAFVQAMAFQHVGVFPYSSEQGTRAGAEPDDVSARVKQQRRATLLRLQQGIAHQHNCRQIGAVVPVLIERATRGGMLGRRAGDAPDVDNCVHVRGARGLAGRIVPVRITRAAPYDLHGRLVAPAGKTL